MPPFSGWGAGKRRTGPLLFPFAELISVKLKAAAATIGAHTKVGMIVPFITNEV
jgi:hypothetical protein